ncbi:MAG: ABC transporter ATP-binding protein/permease, partial [Bacilli bacterium]|nr:ABC transporter ATP-binding protein/permease [Bacilli bacterium]
HVSLEFKKKEVLHNINLKVDHNEVVAIVGEAGSGKTMMLNLLLRLYKPTKGSIKIDNVDIFEFSKESYSKIVSVVNQKPFIFNMSIRKNLDFVDSNIEHQIEACKKAGIHDFIETLPNGYNTVLRENGSNISGGQKQMISIARTILSKAEVILLDDITTSLDPDTAKLVPKLIENLKKDHTIIMITKKPDLMKIADRIVVLDDGKIQEVGTHKELIKHNEIYQLLQSRKSPSRIGVFDND